MSQLTHSELAVLDWLKLNADWWIRYVVPHAGIVGREGGLTPIDVLEPLLEEKVRSHPDAAQLVELPFKWRTVSRCLFHYYNGDLLQNGPEIHPPHILTWEKLGQRIAMMTPVQRSRPARLIHSSEEEEDRSAQDLTLGCFDEQTLVPHVDYLKHGNLTFHRGEVYLK